MRRGVIIKLGAAGDVLRSTPLLRALDPAKTGTKILWVTHSPELLPDRRLRSRPSYCGNAGANRAGHVGFLLELGQGPGGLCDRRIHESDGISRLHTSGRRALSGGQSCVAQICDWHR